MVSSKNKSTFKELLSKIGLDNKLSLNFGFLSTEINFQDNDKNAAWELYIEMATRIITQPLPDKHGDEKAALDSIFSLFPTTREILKKHGRKTIQFSKIAIPILNQIVRPFTAKWHKLSLLKKDSKSGEEFYFYDSDCKEFRKELKNLQIELKKYNRLLADIAGVEDLTDLEIPS